MFQDEHQNKYNIMTNNILANNTENCHTDDETITRTSVVRIIVSDNHITT